MVFIELKQPWHQPEPHVCVPTVLKVLFENQFNKVSLSIRQWKNRTACDQFGVVPYTAIRDLEEWLITDYKITVNEKANCSLEQLDSLLSRGILPFIYLPMNYLDNDGADPCVDSEGTH